jgi:hypothetical protein
MGNHSIDGFFLAFQRIFAATPKRLTIITFTICSRCLGETLRIALGNAQLKAELPHGARNTALCAARPRPGAFFAVYSCSYLKEQRNMVY